MSNYMYTIEMPIFSFICQFIPK